jgi:hypothetical protein
MEDLQNHETRLAGGEGTAVGRHSGTANSLVEFSSLVTCLKKHYGARKQYHARIILLAFVLFSYCFRTVFVLFSYCFCFVLSMGCTLEYFLVEPSHASLYLGQ